MNRRAELTSEQLFHIIRLAAVMLFALMVIGALTALLMKQGVPW